MTLSLADISGPTTSDIYRAQEMTRWRKCCALLRGLMPVPRLFLSTSLMVPALEIMGSLFLAERQSASVIDFTVWRTSPAGKAIDAYAAQLRDAGSCFWMPFHGGAWTLELMQMALHDALGLAGNLYVRIITPFRCWPWVLGRLVNPDCLEADKQELAKLFMTRRMCCLDTAF